MSEAQARRYRAGQQIEDLCRACKADRVHTVIAADEQGGVIRVVCDFCGSQHNFRGGGNDAPSPAGAPASVSPRLSSDRKATVGPSEGTVAEMSTSESEVSLERLLRRVIRQELGLVPVTPAEKWRGGELILRPGKPGLQEKKWPLDAFFHKIVMVRNRLRTLEQQVNASDLPADAKVRLQAYVSGCYGSLTSFNLLFADEEDQFKGSGGGDEGGGAQS
ncbi:MAG TPA: hypothetical protein VIZ31_07420 [Vicinamibacteria bacterium]